MYDSNFRWTYSEHMWDRISQVWCSECEELSEESDTGQYVCPCFNDVMDSACPHWSEACEIMEAQEQFDKVLRRYIDEE